jgi:hypothetical protein
MRRGDVRDRTRPGVVFQIGVPPVRVDILTSIAGVEFAEAWRDSLETTFSGESVRVLSRRHLIASKKAAGKLQDLADVERLERLETRKKRG